MNLTQGHPPRSLLALLLAAVIVATMAAVGLSHVLCAGLSGWPCDGP